jgi:import inner membrane translocase subunit TIM44
MEVGPVLVVTFQAQQIAYIADATGKVVEGDPVSHFFFLIDLIRYFIKEQIIRINYIFALGRDPTVLDPLAAWRLVDLNALKVNHFV